MDLIKYCLILALLLQNQNLWAYSMPAPTYKEIKRGTNSKIMDEKIRLIINQNELKDFCKEAGIEELTYQFIDEYQSLLFCFSGNSNEKEDLIKITGTRQHSLDLADMTIYLDREQKVKGKLFQPYILYEIRAARSPDQDTSLFILKHHNLSEKEIDNKTIHCALARMIKANTLLNDGKTYTPEFLLEIEKMNTDSLINLLRPFFGKISLENLEVSLGDIKKNDPALFKNIKDSAEMSWIIIFDKNFVKENQLTIKNKLTIKNNEKVVVFDVYQIEASWYSRKGLINVALSKNSKRGIIFITNAKIKEKK